MADTPTTFTARMEALDVYPLDKARGYMGTVRRTHAVAIAREADRLIADANANEMRDNAIRLMEAARDESRWVRCMERAERAEAERDALAAENARLKAALENVAEPVAYLGREAEARGPEFRFDGHAAIALAADANWLRGLARAALAPSSQTQEHTK